MSFTGGSLKLKGAQITKTNKKKKKQKDDTTSKGIAEAIAAPDGAANVTREGYVPPAPEDTRTEAEKKHEAKLLEIEKQRLAKLAATSHRDRVREFNEKLASLSEHHDIPKVGPG